MKDPGHLSALYVIGADVSRRRAIRLARRRAQDQQIFKDSSRRATLDFSERSQVSSQPFPKIDLPIVAERADQLSGLHIEFL